jgi:hypothetical protein
MSVLTTFSEANTGGNSTVSDRIKGFTVTLEKDLRDDDAEGIKNALRSIRGVACVTPSIVNAEDIMNRQQVKHAIWEKFYKIFKEDQ